MDCQMPEMNGIEATKTMRQIERSSGKHTPIIAMTASVLQKDRELCIEAGMDDYICKPVSMDQLQQLILRWLPKTNSLDKPLASSRPTSATDLVDIRQLQDSFNQEDLEELIPLFISEQERIVSALKQALEKEDYRIAGRLLHELKGVGSSLMAEPLATLCAEFEKIIKQNNMSLVHQYRDSVEQMCSDLATYFTQVLEKNTSDHVSSEKNCTN
jgi:DNA-binding response OmpR family regulator